MADDIQSNIRINIDTASAMDSIRLLQNQIAAFHTQMSKMGAASAADARNLQQNLINSVNATGAFTANLTRIKTSAESFTTALEKNKLTMGEYFRYAAASSKSFGRFFQTEFETINKVARERVKDLQTQYIKLGRDASGAMQAIKIRPLALDMDNLSTRTQIAAQRQQLLNQLLKQGSTNLLNFGKNTQWAGRQLMVGFTIPLSIMGSTAMKAYRDIEEAGIRLKRVYGDLGTTAAETEKMVKQVQALALEYTKYGVAVKDSIDMAASAAATGKKGADLLAQVASANKLAVLGGVDQQKALQTTISLTNAFNVSSKDLAKNINFLNAVENQTVLNIEDMTTAIPKAAPVIQQLGGDVKDLAFFLTAMKEGGVNAAEGANAIKSGLASLINPTNTASKMLAGFGINIKGIIEKDKGDLKKTVVDFAQALDTLDPLNRARAIEQLFGKFQFARMSTLFKNVIAQGSQASEVLRLAGQSSLELAMLSQKELNKIQESPLYKFQKAIADFQAQLAPVGEQFMKALTPLINFGTDVLKNFNSLGDGAKQFIVKFVSIAGVIGPVLLMSFGLIANAVANVIKGFALVKDIFNKAGKSSLSLGEQVNYMTQEQLQAAAVASSLDQVHSKLKQTFTSEAAAVDLLTGAYERSIAAQKGFNVPITPRGPVGKYASGGFVNGPGTSTSDSIPAMLSNGEAVIDAETTRKNPYVIQALFAGKKIRLPGYADNNSESFDFNAYERSSTPFGFQIPDRTTQTNAKKIREVLYAASKISDDVLDTLKRSLQNAPKMTTANLDVILKSPQFQFLTSMTTSKANAENPEGRSTGSQGMVKAHATPSRRVTLEEITPFMSEESVASLRNATAINALTNLTFPAPAPLNKSSMKITGNDWAYHIRNFYDDFMSQLAGQGLDTNDPAARAFADNVARQMEQAGTAAIGESEFGEIVGRAISQEIDAVGKNVSQKVKTVFDEARMYGTVQYTLPGEPTRRVPIDKKGVTAYGMTSIPEHQKSYKLIDVLPGAHQRSDEVLAAQTIQNVRNYGIVTAEAFTAAQRSVLEGPENDLAIVTRDAARRNSPHEQASIDGRDDGVAYVDARAKAVESEQTKVSNRTRRRATSPDIVTPGQSQIIIATGSQSKKHQRVQSEGESFIPGQGVVIYPNERPTRGGMENAVTDRSELMTSRKLNYVERAGKSLKFGQKFRGKMFGASMGLGMASMFLPPELSQVTQVASMVTGFAGMFEDMGPKIGKLLIKFADPLKRLIPGIGAAVIAFEIFDKVIVPAVRKNADAYAAITDSLSLTKDKIDKINSFFGSDIKLGGLRTAVIGSVGQTGTQATASEQFRKSQEFKDTYGESAGKLKNLSNTEVRSALQALGTDLIGSGMLKEQVQAIIDAIKTEAGKTSLIIDPKTFEINMKEGSSFLTGVKQSISQFRKNFNEKNSNPITAWFNAEQVEKSKAGAAELGSYINGLSGQLENGLITGKEYNDRWKEINIELQKVSQANPTAAFDLMQQALTSLNPEMATAIKNLTGIQQALIIQAKGAGLNPDNALVYAMGSGTPDQKAEAEKNINEALGKVNALKTISDNAKKKITSLQNSTTDLSKLEEKINQKYDTRISRLEEIKKLNDQISKSQQGQLSLAEALNSGDIGAAARAAMEIQKTDIQNALELQQSNLERARQSELKPIQQQQSEAQSKIDTLNSTIENATIDASNITIKPVKGEVNAPPKLVIMDNGRTWAFDAYKVDKGNPTPDFISNKYLTTQPKIPGSATGGHITGPGSGTSDSIPAMLSNGEYVIRANAVKTIGVDVLNRLNQADRIGFKNGGYNGYANGGMVGYKDGGKPKPPRFGLDDIARGLSNPVLQGGGQGTDVVSGYGVGESYKNIFTGKADFWDYLTGVLAPFSLAGFGGSSMFGKIGSQAKSFIQPAVKAMLTPARDLKILAQAKKYKLQTASMFAADRLAPASKKSKDIYSDMLEKINVGRGIKVSASSDEVGWGDDIQLAVSGALNKKTTELNPFGKPKTTRVGNFSAVLSEDSVSDILVQLEPEFQKMGIGKNLTAQLMELGSNVGARNVLIKASLTDGGYAWAKAGFKFLEKPTNVISRMDALAPRIDNPKFHEILGKLKATGDPKKMISPKEILALKENYRKYISEKELVDFYNSRALVNEETLRKAVSSQSLGELILRGSNWEGYKRLGPQIRVPAGLSTVLKKIKKPYDKIGSAVSKYQQAKLIKKELIQSANHWKNIVRGNTLSEHGIPDFSNASPRELTRLTEEVLLPEINKKYLIAETAIHLRNFGGETWKNALKSYSKKDELVAAGIDEATMLPYVEKYRKNGALDLGKVEFGVPSPQKEKFEELVGIRNTLQNAKVSAQRYLRLKNKDYTIPLGEAPKFYNAEELITDDWISRLINARRYANGGMVRAAVGGMLLNGKFFGGFANGGMVPSHYAMGGFAMGTDTVPAMLTPGEFVIKKSAADRIGKTKLDNINNGTTTGDSVYNYSVNVNVRSDANPDQIARAVMTQIKQIDNHRVRGSAF
jgi:TP901 family phage tail tape measure protein